MNKLILTAVATTAVLTSAAAAAPFQTKTGVVSQINVGEGRLVLANGEQYSVPNHALLYGYVPGDAVVVGFKVERGQLIGRSLFRVPSTIDSHGTNSISRSQRA